MFVEGGIPLDVPIESLAVMLPVSSQEALKEGNMLPHYYKIKITFQYPEWISIMV